LAKSRARRLIATLLLVMLLPVIIFISYMGVNVYKARSWSAEPREVDGAMVFEPYLSNHPAHYSPEESRWMLEKISFLQMLTDGRELEGLSPLLSFGGQNTMGAAAHDFDLETTDGDRLELSSFRGRIVAFMFVACT
jgi:hypothetical protein